LEGILTDRIGVIPNVNCIPLVLRN
jgi:hypothetical protein